MVSLEYDDLEPLRVVAAEAYSEIPKDSDYENWEDTCLAKFSEFLGFSSRGF